MGPVIAGRLYGRAHRIAMQLRVPRPDGNVDQGDAALVRLPVDEVRDPNSRYEEAHERAGLQLNDVAKYYLWFKGSGLPPRTIDDIKLQVNGDFRRFEDARALALRITPNKETKENEIFYGHDEDEWWYDAEEYNQYY